ncbi:MAG: hypothetical protein CL944_00135 [Candidatus Diapherotrites archaeon]|uniref:Uncharacterized protein n=1 Tax=Candidatus Iainarchaeum sp. TaxID=3101447 RepID=A0A2D6LNV5_9ARCH|nr:hypothetical protein [Candidatus Diapherotrites archaeon]|tara:strand:+ start:9194 stop:9733 length:540 start_codon:yes stop_codon:yes gene_type:complete
MAIRGGAKKKLPKKLRVNKLEPRKVLSKLKPVPASRTRPAWKRRPRLQELYDFFSKTRSSANYDAVMRKFVFENLVDTKTLTLLQELGYNHQKGSINKINVPEGKVKLHLAIKKLRKIDYGIQRAVDYLEKTIANPRNLRKQRAMAEGVRSSFTAPLFTVRASVNSARVKLKDEKVFGR